MKEDNKKQSGIKKLVDDAAITAAIKAKLAADSLAKALTAHVTTNKGIVTLTGSVLNQETAAKIEEIALGTEGVQEVINDVEIEE